MDLIYINSDAWKYAIRKHVSVTEQQLKEIYDSAWKEGVTWLENAAMQQLCKELSRDKSHDWKYPTLLKVVVDYKNAIAKYLDLSSDSTFDDIVEELWRRKHRVKK